jgi:hypothetical protein
MQLRQVKIARMDTPHPVTEVKDKQGWIQPDLVGGGRCSLKKICPPNFLIKYIITEES